LQLTMIIRTEQFCRFVYSVARSRESDSSSSSSSRYERLLYYCYIIVVYIKLYRVFINITINVTSYYTAVCLAEKEVRPLNILQQQPRT